MCGGSPWRHQCYALTRSKVSAASPSVSSALRRMPSVLVFSGLYRRQGSGHCAMHLLLAIGLIERWTSPTAAFQEGRLRVGPLLDHRLGWLWGRYGVRVTVHDLPSALFGPEYARDAQTHGADILTVANLGPVALHLHDVGKLRG